MTCWENYGKGGNWEVESGPESRADESHFPPGDPSISCDSIETIGKSGKTCTRSLCSTASPILNLVIHWRQYSILILWNRQHDSLSIKAVSAAIRSRHAVHCNRVLFRFSIRTKLKNAPRYSLYSNSLDQLFRLVGVFLVWSDSDTHVVKSFPSYGPTGIPRSSHSHPSAPDSSSLHVSRCVVSYCFWR